MLRQAARVTVLPLLVRMRLHFTRVYADRQAIGPIITIWYFVDMSLSLKLY